MIAAATLIATRLIARLAIAPLIRSRLLPRRS
jgi:hypothetical protein